MKKKLLFILGLLVAPALLVATVYATNPLPTDNYDSRLSAPLSSVATTAYVSDLPSVSSSVYTLYASDGVTPREKIYCTGTAISPNRLTGCVRGLSFSPSVNGTITEDAGTGLTHGRNTRIAITDNINFTGKVLAILNGSQPSNSSNFRVGTGLNDGFPTIYFEPASSTSSNRGFLRYQSGSFYFSTDNGASTFLLNASGTVLSASSGLFIINGGIGVSTTAESGLQFDSAGRLITKLKSAGGVTTSADGLAIDTTASLNWTSPTTTFTGVVSTTGQTTFNGTTTFNKIPTIPTTTPANDNDVVSRNYIDNLTTYGRNVYVSSTQRVVTLDNAGTTYKATSTIINTFTAATGTAFVIRAAVYSNSDGNTETIALGYGNTTTAVTLISHALTSGYGHRVLQAYIVGRASTTSQYFTAISNAGANISASNDGSGSIDISNGFNVWVSGSNSTQNGKTMYIEYITVEKIVN